MAAAAGIRLGANSTVNRNTGSYGSPTWSAIASKDVTINLEFEKADVTTRQSLGFKQSEPTLLGLSVEYEILEIPLDTTFLAIRNAFINKTVIDTLLSSGTSAASGESTVRADMKVTGFKKGEPLNGVNTHTVTLEPCYSANPVVIANNA
jgi:hypothetical protein